MSKRSEINSYLEQEPQFDDFTFSQKATTRQPNGIYKEIKEVVALARRFNDEVIRKYDLDMDRTMQQDYTYLPWDLVRKANEWGFFSMWFPKLFGGKGYSIPTLAHFMEETGSVCLGLSNLICVHYLAVTSMFSSWNLRVVNKLCRMVAEGERTGEPCLLSTAITEPGAGTDVEEVDLVDSANLGCYATRVEGGYKLNGSKVFISSGHVSTFHIVISYVDKGLPSENVVMLPVKTGSPGFRFGRAEHKMGVKICPASELIFEDCFVPDDMVLIHPDDSAKRKQGAKHANAMLLDSVLAASRAGVAAWGTAAARGAYETALDFALSTEVEGKLLVNHEWAQCMLAEMYKNVSLGRLAYEETNYAVGLYGIFKTIQFKPFYYYLKFMPQPILDKLVAPFVDMPVMSWLYKKIHLDWSKEKDYYRTAGWGSLAKFASTDLGMKNCQMALEMMGQTGLRQDRRAEKILRDSKLLQIYEGTNQLNRLNLFKCLVAKGNPKIKVFQKEQED